MKSSLDITIGGMWQKTSLKQNVDFRAMHCMISNLNTCSCIYLSVT